MSGDRLTSGVLTFVKGRRNRPKEHGPESQIPGATQTSWNRRPYRDRPSGLHGLHEFALALVQRGI